MTTRSLVCLRGSDKYQIELKQTPLKKSSSFQQHSQPPRDFPQDLLPLYVGSIHQSTHLDVLIPASGDNDGDLVVGGEPDAAHPVAVAVLLQLAAGHGGTGSAFKHFGTLKCFFLAKKVLLCAHVLGIVHHCTYLLRIPSLLQAVSKRSM